VSLNVPDDHGGHILTAEHRFCLEGCSTYKQYHQMRFNFERDICVFCKLDRTKNEVLWEDKHFMVWKVPDGVGKKRPLRHHILIVPKAHVRFVADLSFAAAISLIKANRFARDELGYTGGLNHAREGDMRNNAGTVPHLHFNLFEPDGSAEVRVPVYKDPRDRTENQARSTRFGYWYNKGVTPKQYQILLDQKLVSEDGHDLSPKK
jgi:diadenosine tetraphosphate (Ap4A) HIT family hydrolase